MEQGVAFARMYNFGLGAWSDSRCHHKAVVARVADFFNSIAAACHYKAVGTLNLQLGGREALRPARSACVHGASCCMRSQGFGFLVFGFCLGSRVGYGGQEPIPRPCPCHAQWEGGYNCRVALCFGCKMCPGEPLDGRDGASVLHSLGTE
jgi:hypothetical protein